MQAFEAHFLVASYFMRIFTFIFLMAGDKAIIAVFFANDAEPK